MISRANRYDPQTLRSRPYIQRELRLSRIGEQDVCSAGSTEKWISWGVVPGKTVSPFQPVPDSGSYRPTNMFYKCIETAACFHCGDLICFGDDDDFFIPLPSATSKTFPFIRRRRDVKNRFT